MSHCHNRNHYRPSPVKYRTRVWLYFRWNQIPL